MSTSTKTKAELQSEMDNFPAILSVQSTRKTVNTLSLIVERLSAKRREEYTVSLDHLKSALKTNTISGKVFTTKVKELEYLTKKVKKGDIVEEALALLLKKYNIEV